MLELMTYRITGHSRRDPALYQPEEERKAAKESEPIGRFTRYLLDRRVATADSLKQIDGSVDAEIEAAVKAAMAAPLPKPDDVFEDIFV